MRGPCLTLCGSCCKWLIILLVSYLEYYEDDCSDCTVNVESFTEAGLKSLWSTLLMFEFSLQIWHSNSEEVFCALYTTKTV